MKNKIVIAPDSFKGSADAKKVADSLEKGILSVSTNVEVIKIPIADGGEGTLSALVGDDSVCFAEVKGPSGQSVKAALGFLNDTAVVEMAQAAGLTLVDENHRSAKTATTYGVGQMITYALDRGYRRFLLTAGGSATNDGGTGMFCALGCKFYRADGECFVPTGATLGDIEKIDVSELDGRLSECSFTVATDVKNPLCGETGATYVYAPQKGADENDLALMEAGMKKYASLLNVLCGSDVASIEGCGAGGGIATPLLAFCNAKIISGIEAVLETAHFKERLAGASYVLTGEGKIDIQSLYGKAISGVAKEANRQNIPVICFVGCVGDDKEKLKELGVSDIFATSDIAPSAEYSMAHAEELLEKLAKSWFANCSE